MPRLPRFRGEDTSTKSPVAATTGFMSGMAPSLHAPGPRYLRDRARVAYGSDGQKLNEPCSPHDFVRRHERSLDVIDARIYMPHNRSESRSRKVVARLLDSHRPGHFRQQFGGVVLVRRERNPDMTVRDNAFIRTIRFHNLSNILRDQIGLYSIASHVRQRVRENLHAVKAGKFVDQ